MRGVDLLSREPKTETIGELIALAKACVLQTVVLYREYRITHYWKQRLEDIEGEGTQCPPSPMMMAAKAERDEEFGAFRKCCYRIATAEYYRVVEASKQQVESLREAAKPREELE